MTRFTPSVTSGDKAKIRNHLRWYMSQPKRFEYYTTYGIKATARVKKQDTPKADDSNHSGAIPAITYDRPGSSEEKPSHLASLSLLPNNDAPIHLYRCHQSYLRSLLDLQGHWTYPTREEILNAYHLDMVWRRICPGGMGCKGNDCQHPRHPRCRFHCCVSDRVCHTCMFCKSLHEAELEKADKTRSFLRQNRRNIPILHDVAILNKKHEAMRKRQQDMPVGQLRKLPSSPAPPLVQATREIITPEIIRHLAHCSNCGTDCPYFSGNGTTPTSPMGRAYPVVSSSQPGIDLTNRDLTDALSLPASTVPIVDIE